MCNMCTKVFKNIYFGSFPDHIINYIFYIIFYTVIDIKLGMFMNS